MGVLHKVSGWHPLSSFPSYLKWNSEFMVTWTFHPLPVTHPSLWHWPVAATVKQCLTFEQGQRGELHLGALVAELGRAVGPPLSGSAHRPAREPVHLLRGRHREAGGRRGRAGRRQLGRLHDGRRWRRSVRACVPLRDRVRKEVLKRMYGWMGERMEEWVAFWIADGLWIDQDE